MYWGPDDKTDLDLMRSLARRLLWDVHYHERELHLEHKKIRVVEALMKAVNFNISKERAEEIYNAYSDDEELAFDDPETLVGHLFGEALHNIAYHEQELSSAHGQLAAYKALLARTNYEISLDEIARKIRDEEEERAA